MPSSSQEPENVFDKKNIVAEVREKQQGTKTSKVRTNGGNAGSSAVAKRKQGITELENNVVKRRATDPSAHREDEKGDGVETRRHTVQPYSGRHTHDENIPSKLQHQHQHQQQRQASPRRVARAIDPPTPVSTTTSTLNPPRSLFREEDQIPPRHRPSTTASPSVILSRDEQSASTVKMILAEYDRLEKKYKALKQLKIQEVETLLSEQSKHVEKHSEAAKRLTRHWKEEAERRHELATRCEVTEQQVLEYRRANAELKHALLEAEASKVATERTMTDLKRQLQQAQRAQSQAEALVVEAKRQASLREGLQGDVVGSLELLTGFRSYPSGAGIHYQDPTTGMAFELQPGVATRRSGEEEEEESGQVELEDEVEYVPLKLGAVAPLLADYLRESISFDVKQMPQFLGRLLPAIVQARRLVEESPMAAKKEDTAAATTAATTTTTTTMTRMQMA